MCPCITSISLKYNQKDATFSRSIYFYNSAHHQENKTVHTASGIVKPLPLPAVIVEEKEIYSISSTIAAGSSICTPDDGGEEPPETCTAIYRNK